MATFIKRFTKFLPLIHPLTHSSKLPRRVSANRREQFGVQCVAQGHSDMRTRGGGDRNTINKKKT